MRKGITTDENERRCYRLQEIVFVEGNEAAAEAEARHRSLFVVVVLTKRH